MPKWSQDEPTICYTLEEIDRVRYRVERMLLMPKHEQWLRREAFVRTAYSSTMVENADIPEEEMENAARHSPVSGIPKDRSDVSNYAGALEFVGFLCDAEIMVDEALVRQVHWSLMKGINDPKIKPGQYRTEPNWIEEQGVKVYEPPFHADVPVLMREFSLWLRDDTAIHPLLKAGMAHAHLAAIHPFVDGNGRTARLLATLISQKLGYGFRKLLSLDAYYQRNRDQYVDALSQSFGKTFKPDYDATPWLRFFLQSKLVQASILETRLADWRMMVDEVHQKLGSSGLSERQIDGMIYAARSGYITRKDYAEIAGVSLLTATRDLADLAERKVFKPQGTGRNRVYRLLLQASPTKAEEPQGKLL